MPGRVRCRDVFSRNDATAARMACTRLVLLSRPRDQDFNYLERRSYEYGLFNENKPSLDSQTPNRSSLPKHSTVGESKTFLLTRSYQDFAPLARRTASQLRRSGRPELGERRNSRIWAAAFETATGKEPYGRLDLIDEVSEVRSVRKIPGQIHMLDRTFPGRILVGPSKLFLFFLL